MPDAPESNFRMTEDKNLFREFLLDLISLYIRAIPDFAKTAALDISLAFRTVGFMEQASCTEFAAPDCIKENES